MDDREPPKDEPLPKELDRPEELDGEGDEEPVRPEKLPPPKRPPVRCAATGEVSRTSRRRVATAAKRCTRRRYHGACCRLRTRGSLAKMDTVQSVFGFFLIVMFGTFGSSMLFPGLWRSPAIPERTAASILAREVVAAESIGFSLEESDSVELAGEWMGDDEWVHTWQLGDGQCIALVMVTEGDQALRGTTHLTSANGDELATGGEGGEKAVHLQWCADHAQSVSVTASFGKVFFMGHNAPGEDAPGTLHYRLLRADAAEVGGRAGLNRGWVLRDDPSAS